MMAPPRLARSRAILVRSLLQIGAGLCVVSSAAYSATTRVPPSATQAPADRLLDSAALVRAAERLQGDRVHIATIGTSAGGRPIVMIAVTAPGEPLESWQLRANQLSGPHVAYRTLKTPTREDVALDTLLPSSRLPVMFAGASWGHEASQVEGLLAAAEFLATDRSPVTERALRRLVVLIVPLMNPDGRDRAIAEWRRTPLSNGDEGVGNDAGFMLNRDFIHQTQPETQAILKVTREWRPVVGIDLHEDVNRLGLDVPEVAFVPPYMPGFDVEEDPGTRRAIVRVGDAIAQRWREAGFAIVHDPAGDRKWVPMPPKGSGELNPVAGSSGRLEFLWNIHAITGLITESARTPGTQTWESRVEQKKLAVLATAEAVASDPSFFARTVLDRRTAAARADKDMAFVAVPHAQPAGADRAELIRLLRDHDVLVYRAAGQPFDVVPLAQPERAFVQHTLLAERSKLNDLGSALGVRVVGSAALRPADRDRLISASLELYPRATIAWPKAGHTAKVAIYDGQGVDRAASGELHFVLMKAGFSPAALGADQIRSGELSGFDAIVFGDGSAREIIDGWDMNVPTRKAPWQPAQPSRGIGREGTEALARFVRGGGRLVTIGRSAGVAAPSLVDVRLPAERPGIGEVRLRVAPSAQWLFAGVPLAGQEGRGVIVAPPGGRDGGFLLRPSIAAHAAAWYAGAVDRPGEQSFADTTPLSADAGNAAIVSVEVGKGRLVMFGFSPVFRAQWRATFPLLFNAVGAR